MLCICSTDVGVLQRVVARSWRFMPGAKASSSWRFSDKSDASKEPLTSEQRQELLAPGAKWANFKCSLYKLLIC